MPVVIGILCVGCDLARHEMITKSTTKTLGTRSAHLLAELYERRLSTFSLKDVTEITGLSAQAARSLIYKAQRRGLVTRLKSGLYNLVPFELGHATQFVTDPYVIARDAVRGAPYFLSHATAFELHRLTTQPNVELFVSSPRRFRPQSIGGYKYRFVFVRPAQFFGVTTHWVTKEQSVAVSDLERTLIDGLRRPEYVGGVTEVAKALWMKREKVQVSRLIDYALRLDVRAVRSRLGFLLERYGLADSAAQEQLRRGKIQSYDRLDPLLKADGPRLARWRLQLNVAPEELDAVRFG
jgi:predicted transcriptional regulator of viral defense system